MSQLIQERANFGTAAEEQGPVVGFEGLETPIGVALGKGDRALFRRRSLQGVAQLRGGREARRRVPAQATMDDCGQLPIHLAGGGKGLGVLFQDRLPQRIHPSGTVRRMPGVELVQKRADGIHVGAEGGWLAPPNFGSDVCRSPDQHSVLCQIAGRCHLHCRRTEPQFLRFFGIDVPSSLRTASRNRGAVRPIGDPHPHRQAGGFLEHIFVHFPDEFGQPEIEQLCFAAVREDDISGFDVPMEHVVLVHCGQTAGQPNANLQDAFAEQGKGQLVQCLAPDPFVGDVRTAIDFADPIDRYNVRVL